MAQAMLLFFRCAGINFALDVTAVERASFLVAVQPLPEASDYVVGVTSLGGATVLLADLALRLGLPDASRYTLHTPVVWCRGAERVAGLVVDEIDGVEAAAVQNADLSALLYGGRAPLRGAVRRSGAVWLLLDPERLLAFDLAQPVSDLRLDMAALQQWLLAGEEQAEEDADA